MRLPIKRALFISCAIILLAACVKEVSESSESIQRRILESYIKVHYNNSIKPTASGMYIIQNVEGTGRKVTDSTYGYVRYSSRSLDGVYLSTCYDTVAQQLGSYKPINFYGDFVWPLGMNGLSSGLDEVLSEMRIGGKTTAIIPPWLLDVETGDNISDGDGIIKIYEIELDTLVNDIKKYEIEQLEAFSKKHYQGMDSVSLGYYFKKIASTGTTDTIENNSSISVYYVGKLLNGKIFDTNIADTAKKYRLYSGSDSDYEPLSYTYYTDYDEAIENSSTVDGFTKAIFGLTYGDRAITFFNSDLGYGSEGSLSSGKGVPGYYPMFFEIYISE